MTKATSELWTFGDILAFGPCYDLPTLRRFHEQLFPAHTHVTPLEICNCEGLLPTDRIWLLCCTDVAAAVVELIVTRAVRTHCLGCHIPAVSEWAEKWLSGEDRTRASALRTISLASPDAKAAVQAGCATSSMITSLWSALSSTVAAASLAAEKSHKSRIVARKAELQLQLQTFRDVLTDERVVLVGWWEEYRCGCVSASVRYKKDLLGYCAKHGERRRSVHTDFKTLNQKADHVRASS